MRSLLAGIKPHHKVSESLELSQEQKDAESLGSVITQLENHLGINKTSESNKQPVENGGAQQVPQMDLSSMLNGMKLDEMFNVATSAMKKGGINIPDGVKPPSGEEFSTMINGLMSNPQVSGFVNNLFQSFQQGNPQSALNDLPAVLGSFANQMGNVENKPVETKTISEGSPVSNETLPLENQPNVSLVEFD